MAFNFLFLFFENGDRIIIKIWNFLKISLVDT